MALALLTLPVWAQTNLIVMTWNLRYDAPSDGTNGWMNRREAVAGLVRFNGVDLLCTQEGLTRQLDYLREELKTHDYVGVGRDDGDKKGEYTAIFYRKDRFKVIAQNTFWLSETPAVLSKGWDAALVRICTWVKFEDRLSGQVFYLFNTHFDHMGKLARERSAELIVKKSRDITEEKYPVIIAGDFNATDNEPPYQVMSRSYADARLISREPPFGPLMTFNAFHYDKPAAMRIDYIFTDKNIGVKRYGVLNNSYDQRYPSDHFPVLVELLIKGDN